MAGSPAATVRAMNIQIRRMLAALAICFAIGACAGAQPTPGATDEAQETEFVEPDETEFVEPEETQPDFDPGPTPAIDPSTYDDGNGWSVTPTVTLSGTGTFLLDGVYTATDKARICGLTSFDLYGNTDAFTFEFPSDQFLELNDISFRAEHLAPGTTTSAFHVSALIVKASGQSAPAFAFDTVVHADTDSGTATMHEENGHRILDVEAVNDLGHHLRLHADCIPPAS